MMKTTARGLVRVGWACVLIACSIALSACYPARVLYIYGDSTMIAIQDELAAELLARDLFDEVFLNEPGFNGQSTAVALVELPARLPDGVTHILFNAGLRDMADGVPIDQYLRNLEAISDLLRERGVTVMFKESSATHEDVTNPGTLPGGLWDDVSVRVHNAVAHRLFAVERASGSLWVSFYGVTRAHPEWYEDGVHFLPGSELAAALALADAIEVALAGPQLPPGCLGCVE